MFVESNNSPAASTPVSNHNQTGGGGGGRGMPTHTITDAEQESFRNFFECWLVEQNRHLQELISASKDPSIHGHEDRVRPLLNRVVRHYEHYYRAKSNSAKHDVIAMFSPSWTSSLEDAFLWVGGWRPSMAFHLLYSKAGLQLEVHLADILRGLSTSDLGDLSPSQLARADELQLQTIREEMEISEKMAKQQETVADSTMVELSHAVTEMMAMENGVDGVGDVEESVEMALESKKEGLESILRKADDLRLRTLMGVIGILEPLQAVHFLIAAAELHLRLHELGKRTDEMIRNSHHQS